jgi:hypothetical protein
LLLTLHVQCGLCGRRFWGITELTILRYEAHYRRVHLVYVREGVEL